MLLDDWQIGCCGTPPAVGDTASWRLVWAPWCASVIPSTMALRARLEQLPPDTDDRYPRANAGEDTVPAIAKAHGIDVFVQAPLPLQEDLTLTGVLHEDHHVGVPPGFPRTTGRITAVWLMSWKYRRGNGRWHSVEGTARFTSVEQAPKHLRMEPPPDHAEFWWFNNSVLANLEITPD
ncbi:DUF6578 domain-containing protein [Amycolatopsis nigrescens]|uniref:DUF6578 domain-containing protein n=1 Tax=Amycolatopsis nigrescens TaxID=381445 RepID=UPI00316ABDBA